MEKKQPGVEELVQLAGSVTEGNWKELLWAASRDLTGFSDCFAQQLTDNVH